MHSCYFGEPLFSLKDFTVNFYRGRKLELGKFENLKITDTIKKMEERFSRKFCIILYNLGSFIISVMHNYSDKVLTP